MATVTKGEELQQIYDEYAIAHRQYEKEKSRFNHRVVAFLERMKGDGTYRDLEGIAVNPGNGVYYTYQYIFQVMTGGRPSVRFVKALIEGLRTLENDGREVDDEAVA